MKGCADREIQKKSTGCGTLYQGGLRKEKVVQRGCAKCRKGCGGVRRVHRFAAVLSHAFAKDANQMVTGQVQLTRWLADPPRFHAQISYMFFCPATLCHTVAKKQP